MGDGPTGSNEPSSSSAGFKGFKGFKGGNNKPKVNKAEAKASRLVEDEERQKVLLDGLGPQLEALVENFLFVDKENIEAEGCYIYSSGGFSNRDGIGSLPSYAVRFSSSSTESEEGSGAIIITGAGTGTSTAVRKMELVPVVVLSPEPEPELELESSDPLTLTRTLTRSRSRTMQFPPELNSYQRLFVHETTDRLRKKLLLVEKSNNAVAAVTAEEAKDTEAKAGEGEVEKEKGGSSPVDLLNRQRLSKISKIRVTSVSEDLPGGERALVLTVTEITEIIEEQVENENSPMRGVLDVRGLAVALNDTDTPAPGLSASIDKSTVKTKGLTGGENAPPGSTGITTTTTTTTMAEERCKGSIQSGSSSDSEEEEEEEERGAMSAEERKRAISSPDVTTVGSSYRQTGVLGMSKSKRQREKKKAKRGHVLGSASSNGLDDGGSGSGSDDGHGEGEVVSHGNRQMQLQMQQERAKARKNEEEEEEDKLLQQAILESNNLRPKGHVLGNTQAAGAGAVRSDVGLMNNNKPALPLPLPLPPTHPSFRQRPSNIGSNLQKALSADKTSKSSKAQKSQKSQKSTSSKGSAGEEDKDKDEDEKMDDDEMALLEAAILDNKSALQEQERANKYRVPLTRGAMGNPELVAGRERLQVRWHAIFDFFASLLIMQSMLSMLSYFSQISRSIFYILYSRFLILDSCPFLYS